MVFRNESVIKNILDDQKKRFICAIRSLSLRISPSNLFYFGTIATRATVPCATQSVETCPPIFTMVWRLTILPCRTVPPTQSKTTLSMAAGIFSGTPSCATNSDPFCAKLTSRRAGAIFSANRERVTRVGRKNATTSASAQMDSCSRALVIQRRDWRRMMRKNRLVFPPHKYRNAMVE